MILEISIIIISILLSAFFSCMEIAFISANKMHIELEKKKDTLLAKTLSKLTQKPSKFITTMLVGNNIALVVYGYFMGDLIMKFLAPSISNNFLFLLIQTLISTILILNTAEFYQRHFLEYILMRLYKYLQYLLFSFL